ncbi:MAG: hypothetical protein L0Y72_28820 [Gemmataceae bacterium]|nr:hypothetical protein [Gemmataceae bacterium]MCI0743051.1 hypothetical protein [Gemmataceae bacterium]
MSAIDCPRCGRVWYDDDVKAGSKRLCAECVRKLKERRRRPWRLDAFAITTITLCVVSVLFIALTALWPTILGVLLLGYGLVLLTGGLLGLGLFTGWWYRDQEDTDWSVARWGQMLALMGGACAMASYFALR